MTERLYYRDCYLREFRARVIDSTDDGRRVYLDRTAFYPASGGQPFDTGALSGAAMVDVVDEGDRIAHILDSPLKETEVKGRVDWPRRFDHMQQHTGQHLLSAVLMELFGVPTLSFHMGAAVSTIEVGAETINRQKLEKIEERCAEMVAAARRVAITFEDSSSDLGLRKESGRTGTLRIVSIEGLDRSACGGTHVRSTAEIGPVLIRKLDKIRGHARIEFVCGLRALRQAREDFRNLSEISRVLSVPLEDTPALVSAESDKTKALEKTCQRLAMDLAQREGRELYASTVPDTQGMRRIVQRGLMDDTMRSRAQAFAAGSKSFFLAICDSPPSLLLAVSADSGMHAGERVKAAVTAAGGRGGGNRTLAQGSVPDIANLEAAGQSLL